MYYAAAYPNRVDKIILLDSAPIASEFLKPLQANILDRLSPHEQDRLAALEKSSAPNAQVEMAQINAMALFFESANWRSGRRRPPSTFLRRSYPQTSGCGILSAWGCLMEVNEAKVDDIVLALLYLTTFEDKPRLRAWKGHDWDALGRLHRKEYISDPATKAKSVLLTEAGEKRSKQLFEKYFTK